MTLKIIALIVAIVQLILASMSLAINLYINHINKY